MAYTTPNEDRAEGAADKVKGRLKDAAGAVSGDRSLQAEGRADQIKGTRPNATMRMVAGATNIHPARCSDARSRVRRAPTFIAIGPGWC